MCGVRIGRKEGGRQAGKEGGREGGWFQKVCRQEQTSKLVGRNIEVYYIESS